MLTIVTTARRLVVGLMLGLDWCSGCSVSGYARVSILLSVVIVTPCTKAVRTRRTQPESHYCDSMKTDRVVSCRVLSTIKFN